MRRGRWSDTRATSHGFGSRSTGRRGKSSGFLSETGAAPEPRPCGTPCPPSTVSVRSVTPISGKPIKPLFRASDTEPLAKTVAKRIGLSGSTAPYVNGSYASFARPYRFLRSSKITLARSGTLSITTMRPYSFRTTPLRSLVAVLERRIRGGVQRYLLSTENRMSMAPVAP